MARAKRSIHYVYKSTNLINGRYYIGKHSAFVMNDGYMGSGKRLRCELNKYGKENFKFEIIEFFETSELALEKEKHIVNEILLKDSLCMNIQIGGTGGWEHAKISASERSRIGKLGGAGRRRRLREDPEYRKQCSDRMSVLNTRRSKEVGYVSPMKGKHLSDSAKQKLRQANLGKHLTEESKAKISAKLVGRKFSEQHLQRLRDAWVLRKLNSSNMQS